MCGGAEVVGDLGWLAYPPSGSSEGLRVGDRRQDVAGISAGICSRSEPLGRRRLALSQGCGNAQPGVPGLGRVASGVPPRGRTLAPEAPFGSILLCTGWVASQENVTFSAQRSVNSVCNFGSGLRRASNSTLESTKIIS